MDDEANAGARNSAPRPRFPLIQAASGNPELERLYRDMLESGFGDKAPINWLTSQASRPDILAATWGLVKGILIGGKLPAAMKQMIALTISAQHNCRYCKVVHSGALETLGVPKDLIDSCARDFNGDRVPKLQRDVLKFALQAAKNPNSLTDADFQALRENGLSDGEIMEVVMMAAFTAFINIWADASAIALD